MPALAPLAARPHGLALELPLALALPRALDAVGGALPLDEREALLVDLLAAEAKAAVGAVLLVAATLRPPKLLLLLSLPLDLLKLLLRLLPLLRPATSSSSNGAAMNRGCTTSWPSCAELAIVEVIVTVASRRC